MAPWLLRVMARALNGCTSSNCTHGPPVSLQPAELKIAISRPSRPASDAAWRAEPVSEGPAARHRCGGCSPEHGLGREIGVLPEPGVEISSNH
jgi:hypothetical protein